VRIGFDVSQTGTAKAGCGYFAHSLIRALADIDQTNTYLQYPTFGDIYFDPDWKKNIEYLGDKNFRRGLAHPNLIAARSFWGQPPSDFEKMLGNPDIIHANNFFCPVGLRKAKLIYTVYDLIFLQAPDLTTETNRIGCFQGVFKASQFADHIITISNYSREQFLHYIPYYPADQVSVVPLASRYSQTTTFAAPKPPSLEILDADGFWLNVGTLEPRKNQIGILKAYADLRTAGRTQFPLVFAGGKGWQMDHFEIEIEKLGLQNDVIQLGYVNDAQLVWLLQNCFAFIFPSFLEGFGLPVLEAMSQGAAVITSNTTSLPEVIGEAGLLVDPYDHNEISSAMTRLQDDEINRKTLQAKALERSEIFSWERVAQSVLDIYSQVIHS